MNRYGKRCVLYPRVSTEMQVDGYSLEGQKNMLTRFADREEMIVVDTYEDAGKSGKSIEGRPAFQKMLRDIEDGLDIDYILVYKLSRFGRNAADILNSLELVQSYGVNLICIEEGIDSSQTSGKLLISVLSAVAEIERENIIEQTMNGRREKARQGGWNGGFAPYGYTLEDNKLMIEETEAVAIRKIFELYTSSEIGLGGIANQLNLQGIRKIPRQNGTLEDWTGHFIKLILDNPVYCGKIAYGRRTKEKVKGTKNDYQMKRNDDYILTEGQHKGIVSEEVWEKAHAKRLRTGVKQPSKIGRDRVHLLSGLLKCPVCGSPMYTNKHAWTNKDGTYKEIYYYVCSRNRMVRGKHCEYKAMLKKTDIEPMVIEAIREIVRNEEYAQAIKKRIGVQIDTKAVDKELEGYQAKLKEVDLNKTRLEREIDSLPADAKYRERKLHDMTLRLDSLYDVIVELEEKIEDARLRRDAIKQQAITLENIYKIMVNFDCVYNIINDEEKRNVVTALIKEIEIYRNDESEYPLKRIGLNFPVFKDGGEVTELLWDKGNTVDTLKLCANISPDSATNKGLLWTSSNPDIAAVDANGNVRGLSVGSAEILCTAADGSEVTDKCAVTVRAKVKGVTLDQSRLELVIGNGEEAATGHIDFTLQPENAYIQTVTWTSSDESIATVDSTGTVRAISEGVATVFVTSDDPDCNASASCQIVVGKAVSSIQFVDTVSTMNVNSSQAIKTEVLPADASNKKLVWESSDASVVAVDANGNVRAVGNGTADIVCSATDGTGTRQAIRITVITPVSSITPAQREGFILVGGTAKLSIAVAPENATNKDVKWEADSSCVTVSSDGVLTGVSTGTAIVTATATDGSGVACSVKVIVEPKVPVELSNLQYGATIFNYGTLTFTFRNLCSSVGVSEIVYTVRLSGRAFILTKSENTFTLNSMTIYPGRTISDSNYFPKYADARHITVTIDSVTLSDGTKVICGESSYYDIS